LALPWGDETVLVVDDEEDLLKVAQQYLQRLGYTVEGASNAAQALEVLEKNSSIQLLFSDVVMPGDLNGYQLAEQATLLYPDLKVLLTSGFTAKALSSNGQDRFNANLLAKPYNEDEVARRIRFVLDQ